MNGPNSGVTSKTTTGQHRIAREQQAKGRALPGSRNGFFTKGGGGPELLNIAKGIAGSVADEFSKDWEHFKDEVSRPNDFGDHASSKNNMHLPKESAYSKYNGFMEKHDFVGSLVGVGSLPSTTKEIVDIATGGLTITASNLHTINHVKNGGWNYARDLHVNYSSNGTKGTFTYVQANGLHNTGAAQLSTTSTQRSNQLTYSYRRSAISSAVKSSVVWGAPLAVAGDVLICGLDSYNGVTDGICSSPSKFGANVALDVPKVIGSGIVGGIGGQALGVSAAMLTEAFMGAEAGAIGGPLGAGIGFVGGFAMSFWAGNRIENFYINHHSREDLTSHLAGR